MEIHNPMDNSMMQSKFGGASLVEQPEELRLLPVGVAKDDLFSNEAVERGWAETCLRFNVWRPQGFDSPTIYLEKSFTQKIQISQVWDVIESLPDFRIFDTISVLACKSPAQREFDESDRGRITVELTSNGEVRLYDLAVAEIRAAITNVYSSIMRKHFPQEFACFEDWFNRTSMRFLTSSRSLSSADQGWSYVGESLLADDLSTGLINITANPVLGVIWGAALQKLVDNAPGELSKRFLAESNILSYICGTLRESALSELKQAADSVQLARIAALIHSRPN